MLGLRQCGSVQCLYEVWGGGEYKRDKRWLSYISWLNREDSELELNLIKPEALLILPRPWLPISQVYQKETQGPPAYMLLGSPSKH